MTTAREREGSVQDLLAASFNSCRDDENDEEDDAWRRRGGAGGARCNTTEIKGGFFCVIKKNHNVLYVSGKI